MNANPRRALKMIQSQEAQIASVRGQTYTVFGHVRISGTGQMLLPINFPVWFTQQPVISGTGYQAELPDLGSIYPTWQVAAAALRTHPTNDLLYVGATLIVIVEGAASDESLLTWRAEGNALSNPVI